MIYTQIINIKFQHWGYAFKFLIKCNFNKYLFVCKASMKNGIRNEKFMNALKNQPIRDQSFVWILMKLLRFSKESCRNWIKKWSFLLNSNETSRRKVLNPDQTSQSDFKVFFQTSTFLIILFNSSLICLIWSLKLI